MRKVYGKGLNIAAQLNSTRENYKDFTQIKELSGYTLNKIGCGYLQTYFLLSDGQLLKNGYYMDSLTSIRVFNFYRLLPSLFRVFQKFPILGKTGSFKGGDDSLTLLNKKQLLDKVYFEKASFSHSGIHLISEGQMYVIGENYFGQRGTGNCVTNDYSLTKVPYIQSQGNTKNRKQIKDVSCGFQHTLLINEDGQVYGCGKADSFQIQPYKYHYNTEVTTHDKFEVPVLIWNKNRIKKSSCGFKHSIFLTENNKILVLGNNKYGQCGVNYLQKQQISKVQDIYLPFQSTQVVLDIQCGYNHTLILTNYHVYFMGSINRNQNPFAKFKQNICSPTIIDLPSKPIKIFTNFDRSAIITEDGKAYIFGGRDYSGVGGQSGNLQIISEYYFGIDSLIGLGFSHTIIYP